MYYYNCNDDNNRASGTSLWAYWIANFIWDYFVGIIQTFFFTFALYCARASAYEKNDFGLILSIGFLFNFCVILRFYLFSNFVGDIRMAQTFYFYGSLLIQFILTTFYALIVYNVKHGDANTPTGHLISILCTIIDPAFGYLFIVLAQNDFLGIRSQNNDASVASMKTLGFLLIVLFLMIFVYLIGILYFELGFDQLRSFISSKLCFKSKQQVKPNGQIYSTFNQGEPSLAIDPTNKRIEHHISETPNVRIVGELDPDVEEEKRYVSDIVGGGQLNVSQHAIFVSKINKVYYGRGTQPTKVAVKDLSLNISRGEIFGL